MAEPQEELISLRGHTLLCLQGFKGKGYSAEFIENLSRIHAQLMENPQQCIRVVMAPDAVCEACPHHDGEGCFIDGKGSEDVMITQDKRVLSLLGLEVGMVISWQNILERIGASVLGSNLPEICGSCRWLPLGYCAEGIDRVRRHGMASSSESCSDPRSHVSSEESV